MLSSCGLGEDRAVEGIRRAHGSSIGEFTRRRSVGQSDHLCRLGLLDTRINSPPAASYYKHDGRGSSAAHPAAACLLCGWPGKHTDSTTGSSRVRAEAGVNTVFEASGRGKTGDQPQRILS